MHFPTSFDKTDDCIVFYVKFCVRNVLVSRLGGISTSSKRHCDVRNMRFFLQKVVNFWVYPGTHRVNPTRGENLFFPNMLYKTLITYL